jgi:hypothetical protein
MKKYSVYLFFAATLAVFSCFLMSQKPQTPKEKFRAEQLIKAERYLGVTDDSISYALYLLSKKGEHRTVINLSKQLIKHSPDHRQYNAFLASSYYNLQQKDSAQYYTLRYLKQLATKGNITMNDPLMFSKYPTFFPINSDTLLQKKMLRVYLDDYKRKRYPETDLGIRLIELAYDDQKVRNLYTFRLAMCSDSNEVSSAMEKFMEFDRENDRKFLQLFDTHPEYITVAEVGEDASGCQGILINHILDSTARYTTILPMLKRAMDRKEYSPDSYVGAYVYLLMRHSQYDEARKIQDSLCKVYHCVSKIVWE